MNCKAICLMVCSLAFIRPGYALEICGELKQGELVLVKDSNAKVLTLFSGVGVDKLSDSNYKPKNTKDYKFTSNGVALVAFHRDAPSTITIGSYPLSDAGTFYELQIEPAKWDIQRIEGVAQSKVTPDKSHDAEILREQKDVGRSLTHFASNNYWQKGFILPVEGRLSGSFGNQRIFNGIPKSPHTGADIAAPEGTPVKAAGDGEVILSGKDYFYTGNMVIIDHGQGLQTIYAHLKESKVKEGDIVKQGDIIGLVGRTGRATGPHLHWGASLNNVRFRPQSLLDINSKRCQQIDGKYMGE